MDTQRECSLQNAHRIIALYGGPDYQSIMADILADLMHFSVTVGADFQQAVDEAAIRYEEEDNSFFINP